MTIVDVCRKWTGDTGSITSAKSDPNDKTFKFSEVWQVLTDGTDHSPAYIEQVGPLFGLPSIGSIHRSGLEVLCTNIDPKRKTPNYFEVDVSYEGATDEDAEVDVQWSNATTTEPIDRDWAGRAIVTANKEQVDGLSRDIADHVAVITKKFRFINIFATGQYLQAVNSDTFLGWPPGTARLVGYNAQNKFKYGAAQELWTVTARFQFRYPYNNTTAAQAWNKRWRHEGMLVKFPDGTITRAIDDMKQPVTRPVLLKSDGTLETDPDNAYFVHTQVYGSLPFSALGLV